MTRRVPVIATVAAVLCWSLCVANLCVANLCVAQAGEDGQVSIIVRDILLDTVVLDNRQPTAVIFAGGFACSACYGQLERAIHSIDSAIEIVVLLRAPRQGSVVGRKESIKRMESLVQSRTFYFDASAEKGYSLGKYGDGLFGDYGVTISPSVLFLLPGRQLLFLDYTDLFSSMPDEQEEQKDGEERCRETLRTALRK